MQVNRRWVKPAHESSTGRNRRGLSLLLLPAPTSRSTSWYHALQPENGGSKVLKKQWHPTATLQSIMAQKMTWIFTAVKTSYLTLGWPSVSWNEVFLNTAVVSVWENNHMTVQDLFSWQWGFRTTIWILIAVKTSNLISRTPKGRLHFTLYHEDRSSKVLLNGSILPNHYMVWHPRRVWLGITWVLWTC
jgi:hypothetical protein